VPNAHTTTLKESAMTHPFRTTITPLVAVLATAALASSASARPIDATVNRAFTEPLAHDLRMPDTVDAAAGRGTSDVPETTVVKVPYAAPMPDTGVDWVDAAIGAAAGGLLAISIVGAATVRRRQPGTGTRAALG
jgi:hypothetical protein